MFGFGKKKAKPAKASGTRKATPKRTTTKSSTGAKKATPVRKAATPRKTRALCTVCRERTQTDTTKRICGRKRCATELRSRSQGTPAPAKRAAPRRTSVTHRPTAPRTRPAPAAAAAAAPKKTDDLAARFKAAQADAQKSQLRDWNHHHRQWRNEIAHNAAALNQVAARLAGPDRATLNDIAKTAAAITDDHISRTAEADTAAHRSSSTAARLLVLGDRLTTLTVKYEQAGVIRVNRSRNTTTKETR